MQLCVFNLSPLHTPRPRARVGTRAEAGSTGVKEQEAGPELEEELEGGGGGGGGSDRKSFPPCAAAGLQTEHLINKSHSVD